MPSKKKKPSPHQSEVAKAASLYSNSLDADAAGEIWRDAKVAAGIVVDSALSASRNLTKVKAALEVSGFHTKAFRYMLGPPLSQDQFELHCPVWSKSSEKSGRSLKPEVAAAVAASIVERRDKSLTIWLDEKRAPKEGEVEALRCATIALLALQTMGTAARTKSSATQEGSVIEFLLAKGWKRVAAGEIKSQGTLKKNEFAHKVKCATKTEPQEVDIACGLADKVLLAMECKVSNDRTNSIKRINDVLKKARAWKSHWGSFVKTAALLQGVYKASDVNRLTAEGVDVFWSHDLDKFADWLDDND
ncbi:MAG: XamI family restriction endonuclease [Proteobacteria bacterium]|nr:XamI family restriction endonuclease [Pseudomonadota bacterium]